MNEDNFSIDKGILVKIKSYCELNGIEDISGFVNKCIMQGFNIVRYGISPSDNSNREIYGIKDFNDKVINEDKEDVKGEDVGEQNESNQIEKSGKNKKEVKSSKEGKEQIKTKKIRIIKKE